MKKENDNNNIFIIMSGSYIEDSLAAEFGSLPSAFIPAGTKRLLYLQLERTQKLSMQRYVVIPQDYQLSRFDAEFIQKQGAKKIFTDPNSPLHKSLLSVLETICVQGQGAVHVLHGDTLFVNDLEKLGKETDVFSVSPANQRARWGLYEKDINNRLTFRTLPMRHIGEPPEVLSGYFAFSDKARLIRALKLAGSFMDALTIYAMQNDFRPLSLPGWADFGHASTFYQARQTLLSSRQFNEVEVKNRVLIKSSQNKFKISAESDWYCHIPNPLKLYTPTLIKERSEKPSDNDGLGREEYIIEYLPFPSLSELWVFGELDSAAWAGILSGCFSFLKEARICSMFLEENERKRTVEAMRLQLIEKKTLERISSYTKKYEIDVKREWRINGRIAPSIDRILSNLIPLAKSIDEHTFSVMHGDFCFSNIVFDFRTPTVRTFDPRGTIDGSKATVYGSTVYDLAKLAHSVIGLYDFIIAKNYEGYFDLYDCELSFPCASWHANTISYFKELEVDGIYANSTSVLANMILLFFSMLPLHSDCPRRQQALLVNAIRLYQEYEEKLQ